MAREIREHKFFFTSDLHIGHKNILKHCPNRAKTINSSSDIRKHDETIVKRWNSLVRPCDTVIVVGDVSICGVKRANEFLQQLNGKKILIRGNHDSSYGKMRRLGFDFVCEEMKMVLGGNRILISHYPYRLSRMRQYWLKFKQLFYKRQIYDFRSMWKRPVDRGLTLLHAHTHQENKTTTITYFFKSILSLIRYGKLRKTTMIHVGLDSWNMFPVSEDVILKHINIIKRKKNESFR